MASIDVIKNRPFGDVPRMVVYIPEMLENVSDYARQVYIQAAARRQPVLYLALNQRESDPLAAARLLATITALTQDNTVRANAVQVEGEDRADALRQVTHPGDLVVWPDESLLAPASLEKALGISQRVLPGARITAPARALPSYPPALIWLVGLLILVVFTVLEFSLDGLVGGALAKVALMLLFTLEMVAFHAWNRQFR
jgi:hypothetical protein